MHNIFFPKRAIFLVKGAQFLTPQTIFIAFSYMNFLEMPNLKKKSKIFYFFWVFFYIFPFKGLFYHFTKAHKNFSRSHLTLKVAPMCSKAHTINHSVSRGKEFFNWTESEKMVLSILLVLESNDGNFSIV